MKVKITRGTGYGEGAVETMLHTLGITEFERVEEGRAFTCQMPKTLVDSLRGRFFQPHGLIVLEDDVLEQPKERLFTGAELDEATKANYESGYNRAIADAATVAGKNAAIRDAILELGKESEGEKEA